MEPITVILVGIHIYLCAVALYHLFLLECFVHKKKLPSYVETLFTEKEHSTLFCYGIVFLLVSIGFDVELAHAIIHHGSTSDLVILILFACAFVANASSFIFFAAWYCLVRKTA